MSTRVLRKAVLIFLPVALLATGVVYLLYRTEVESASAVTNDRETRLVQIGSRMIVAGLQAVAGDVLYLSKQESLQRWLAGGEPDARDYLERDYLAFLSQKATYDQVRFLGADGREQVRVNWNEGAPIVVARGDLADKSSRYYVAEALALEPGQVYVSGFDLNVEGGVVEMPPKYTVRYAVPVADDAGAERGLVIVNYLGNQILDQLTALAADTSTDLWLLDEDGDWLLGPTAGEAAAERDAAPEESSFAGAYPDVWATMGDGPAFDQDVIGGDLFTHAKVFLRPSPKPSAAVAPQPGVAASWPTLILVAHRSASVLQGTRSELLQDNVGTWLFFIVPLAFGAVGTAVISHRREQAEAKVAASEARFRDFVESAPDAVVITDSDGRILVVNAQTEKLFGYERAQLIGQAVEMLLPERLRPTHVDHRAGYVRSAQPRPMGSGLELHGRRHDGSEVAVAISLSPIRAEEGMMVFCDIRDVTDQRATEHEIKVLNQRLAEDNAELEAVNSELESFSYSVSHDLRAPLRAIDGFSRILLEDHADDLNEEGRSSLQRVRKAAQRMGVLIDDLLGLARVTRTPLMREEIELSSMAEQIVEDLRAEDPERKVKLAVAGDLRVVGDRRLIRIALENLLGNAWKYTAKREVAEIELGRASKNGHAAWFVRDNGVGFDMAYADNLFGAFQRLHDQQEFPGTGIGLATVQRIVNKHGGNLWAEAKPDEGATFYFTMAPRH